MKRIKSDEINSVISQYLKRRRLMDGADNTHRKGRKDQSLPEMALLRTVAKDSHVQAVNYSGTSGEPQAYDSQYTRLRNFVQDACSTHRDSLDALLYPVFVHFYMDMLCNGHKSQAHKFYGRHSGPFLTGQNSEIVNELELMYSKQDITENNNILEFREHRYTVALSTSSLEYLQRHLKHDENVLILQVFNNHIDIKVEGCEINRDLFQHGDRDLEGLEPVSQPCTPENKVIQDEVTLSGLQSCITKVRTGPPPLPSVCMYTFLNTFQGLCCACFSPNENYLIGGFEDSSLRLWDLKPQFNTEISSSASLSAASNSKTCSDTNDTESNADSKSSINNINHIHLSGDYLGDVNTRNKLSTSSADGSTVLKGHSGPVYSCCFTNSSTHVLSSSADTTVRLWDIEKKKNVVCYRGHSYPVWGVDSSSVCDYFCSCSQDHTVRLWNTDRVYPLRTLSGHTADVNIVKFHPNGTYIASGSADKTVRLWSVQDGKSVRLLQGHKSGVFSLAFSQDGNLLASAGEDRRIKVWDLASGTLFKELKGHSDIIYSLCFNKDSSVLASGGMDATLRLWDVRKGVTQTNTQETYSSAELLGAFSTKSSCVHKLMYSHNNYVMLAGGQCS